MSRIFDLRKHLYLKRVSILLLVVALVLGMAGCANRPATDAIEIRDWYDLYDIGNNMTTDYVLANDLDATTDGWEELASPTANDGKGWEPIGSQSDISWFNGVFDGQGHEIKGLFINRPDENKVGLFSVISMTGVIRNVGVVNADVTGADRVGGLVGQASLGYVSNSYCTGSIAGDDTVGGLVGGLWNKGFLKNCYFMGGVIGGSDIGGLVGLINNESTVSNCYATGGATGDGDVGGLVGHIYDGTVSNSFWDSYVDYGDLVESYGGTPKATAEMKDINTFTDTETKGLDESWDIINTAYGETNPACIWNIVDGETYPFLSWEQPRELREIRDWYELHSIRDNACGSYALMNDLDSTTAGYEELAGPGANDGMGWKPIGVLDETFYFGIGFNGIFDGQGHEIRDLFVNRPEESEIGLFGLIAGGVVRNTGLAGAVVIGDSDVGGLAGFTFGGTLSNSYCTGSVTGNTSVGGLVGWNVFSAVGNSYSAGGVTGYENVGGLVGTVDEEFLTLLFDLCSTVYGSYATGNVTGYEDVGGLVGYSSGNVTESYATGNVTGNSYIGGLLGYNAGSMLSVGNIVSNSYSTGSVTGVNYTGGLVGYNAYGIVTDSFWDTETSGQATSDGGTGKNTTEMRDITTFTDVETVGLDEPWDIFAVANPGIRNLSYVWNIVDDEAYPFLSWQP